jgi:hypothetical protein
MAALDEFQFPEISHSIYREITKRNNHRVVWIWGCAARREFQIERIRIET